MKQKKFLVVLLSILVVSTRVDAEMVKITTFEEFLPIGRQAWAAYECSEFAKLSGNQTESARLFELGNAKGREFFEKTKDIEPHGGEIGDAISLRLATITGPNQDFLLGRLFQSTDDSVNSQIFNGPGDIKKRAANKFIEKNCSFVK